MVCWLVFLSHSALLLFDVLLFNSFDACMDVCVVLLFVTIGSTILESSSSSKDCHKLAVWNLYHLKSVRLGLPWEKGGALPVFFDFTPI